MPIITSSDHQTLRAVEFKPSSKHGQVFALTQPRPAQRQNQRQTARKQDQSPKTKGGKIRGTAYKDGKRNNAIESSIPIRLCQTLSKASLPHLHQ